MPEKPSLLSLTPAAFINFLKKRGYPQFYFVYDDVKKSIITSHTKLQPIADYFVRDKRDFLKA